jgi:MFS family permease
MTIAPANSYPSARRAGIAMAVLALLGFFLSMDVTLTTLLIEPMKRDMALTDVEIGLLQGTAFGLAFGLSSIPLGRLIDRHNRVRLLMVGLVIWMGAMAGTAFASNVMTLVIARIALGIVFALLLPAAISIIADLYPPDRRAVATSLFAVGQASGQAFGILAGGLVFDVLTHMLATSPGLLDGIAPWRALYLVAALLAIILLIGLFVVEEPDRQEQSQTPKATGAAFRELWSYRGLLLPLLAAMLFCTITFQAAAVWATPVLIRNHHLTPGQFAGWLSAITFVGGIIGALAGGQLAEVGRRYSGRAGVFLPAIAAAVLTAPLSLFALATTLPVFAAMLAFNMLVGAANATIGVIAISLNIPNEIRGLALGANVFVSAVFGAATAPAAIALLSGTLGGESMLGEAIAGVSLPCALLSALFFLWAMRGARRMSDEEVI